MGGLAVLRQGVKHAIVEISKSTINNIIEDEVGFSPGKLRAGIKLAAKADGHHSWPKFLGGKQIQDLVKMEKKAHQALHRDLNNFLKQVREKTGINMVPSARNNTRSIDAAVPLERRFKTIRAFYKSKVGRKYQDAAEAFEEQFGNTSF